MEDKNINFIDERRQKIERYKEIKRRQSMEAWQERLVEEYKQTKERYEKLKKFNNKREIEARCEVLHYHTLPNEEKRRYNAERIRTDLLTEQQHAMGLYLHWLELRMELEGIEY